MYISRHIMYMYTHIHIQVAICRFHNELHWNNEERACTQQLFSFRMACYAAWCSRETPLLLCAFYRHLSFTLCAPICRYDRYCGRPTGAQNVTFFTPDQVCTCAWCVRVCKRVRGGERRAVAEETHLRRLPARGGPQRRMCGLTWIEQVDGTCPCTLLGRGKGTKLK